jgi:hypothetical protein
MKDRRMALLAGVVALGLLCLVMGPKPVFAEKAYTVPVSSNEITMELRLGNSSTARVLTYEGGLIKVGDLQRQNVFGVVPILKGDGNVRLVLFRIGIIDEQNETIAQIEEQSTPQNAVVTFTKAPVTVKVINVKASLAPAPAPIKDDCCVECDFWSCGICVWMDCGCCCNPPKTCQQLPGGP